MISFIKRETDISTRHPSEIFFDKLPCRGRSIKFTIMLQHRLNRNWKVFLILTNSDIVSPVTRESYTDLVHIHVLISFAVNPDFLHRIGTAMERPINIRTNRHPTKAEVVK